MTTERIPLTQPIESRTGSFAKDSYSSNCFFETRDQKREFIKRPGLVSVAQVVPITPPAYSDSQGLSAFNNKLIAVISNSVYQVDPSGYAVTTVGTTSTSTSQSYFVRTFLDAYLFFHNKVNGYLLSKAGAYNTIVNDKVSNISIDNPGLNYSSGITLSFSATAVAATATVVNGSITEVTITNAGSGLSAAPTCTVTAALTVSPTCTGTINTTTIVASDATGIYIGMAVYGTGIVSTGAKVTSISGTTVTLDIPNIDDVSGTVFFIDQGSGAVLTPALNSFPSGPFVSGAVFLDNYVFIGTTNNRIYNSALGDPTTWGALDYLTFEQTTDTLVGIAKHLNYLVAFGKVSTQFFYDQANSVGSPLGVAASYTSEIGCANGDSIVATSNTVLWVGTSKTFGRSVYIMDGVSAIRVSTANIDRHLEADGLSNVTAYCYTVNGHTLYILTLHNTNQTLVYDLTEKMWYTWTQYSMQSNDQPNPGTYQESYFRPTFYAEINNVPYVLDDDTATLYYFDINTYLVSGVVSLKKKKLGKPGPGTIMDPALDSEN